MDEYIKREAAIRALMNDSTEQVGYSREDAADCIRYMDAADVAPVRHGRWLLDEKRYVVYCSECSKPVSYYPNIKDVREENNYCPNCGAKMDGGEP